MRLLVDAAVWIDHLRRPELDLVRALKGRRDLIHPFTIGEIALGSLRDRSVVLNELGRRPQPVAATDAEVMAMVAEQALHGIGIGWVDAHLLAATLLTPEARLWTRDKRLRAAATRMGIVADELG